MNNDQAVNLQVYVELDDSDEEELDRITRQLLDEIREFDVDSADLVPGGFAPEGSKVVDPILLGAIAVAVGPIVLTKVLDFLHAWAMRREGRRIKLKIQTDANTSLEVEVPITMSANDVKIWIDTLRKTIRSVK